MSHAQINDRPFDPYIIVNCRIHNKEKRLSKVYCVWYCTLVPPVSNIM